MIQPDFQRDSTDPKPLKQFRVLVAEDSPTIRYHLTALINETPGLRVIAEAEDGVQALALAAELRPDVVSMDIRMPNIDGLEATRRIMAECPTPVVVVSGLVERDVQLSFQALEAGALAVVEKPPHRTDPTFLQKKRQLVRALAAMAEVRVVRRSLEYTHTSPAVPITRPLQSVPDLIAIGASAGGPSALSQLLSQLPPTHQVPIVIAQHISHEFVNGLAQWLAKVTPLKVQVSQDGDVLSGGVVHLSPGNAHLTIVRHGANHVTRLIREQGSYRYQPSVDLLFESIAQACGAGALGIILTGMGDDGAAGLWTMRQAGARTIAQDEPTSTVFGMPGAAIERGAVEKILPLANIAPTITHLLKTYT